MVPKPSSKSKATSFNGTLKFRVSKNKVEIFEIFQKMLRAVKVNGVRKEEWGHRIYCFHH